MAPQRPARPARAASAKAPVRTSYSGEAGRRKMEEEQVRQEAEREARKAKGFEPFRFWVPIGETRQIVIIDDAPNFYRYEHALQTPGSNRFDNFLPCINDHANCPACSVSEKPSYFAMYLSVIDLTPYENRDGDEVPWSKKMLVVKPSQQKKIARLYEREGTLRGMILDMTRDGQKDAAIGNDIEFVEWMEEEELATYYSEYEDKDGKTQAIDCLEPFNYEEIYPDLTEDQLATIAGVSDHSVGNRGQVDRSIGRGGRGGREAPRGGRAAGRRDAEAPVRGRRGEAADDGHDDGGQDDAPQRGGRGGRAAPAPAARRGARQEEAPAPTRGGRAAAAPTRGRRQPEAEQEPEYYDDAEGAYQEEAPARPTRGNRAPARAPREEAPAPTPQRGARRPAAATQDAPQRAPRGGRAAAAHEDPPFEDGGEPENSAPQGRAALRARRR